MLLGGSPIFVFHLEYHSEVNVTVLHELLLDVFEIYVAVVIFPAIVLPQEEEDDLVHGFLLLVSLITLLWHSLF